MGREWTQHTTDPLTWEMGWSTVQNKMGWLLARKPMLASSRAPACQISFAPCATLGVESIVICSGCLLFSGRGLEVKLWGLDPPLELSLSRGREVREGSQGSQAAKPEPGEPGHVFPGCPPAASWVSSCWGLVSPSCYFFANILCRHHNSTRFPSVGRTCLLLRTPTPCAPSTTAPTRDADTRRAPTAPETRSRTGLPQPSA